MIHVGIAACWSDLAVAQRLVEDLSNAEFAARLICAGAAADEDGACDVVVALWSPAAFTSLWVRRAAADAAERGRLVEASLTADPSPLVQRLAPARYRQTKACAQRIADRVRRCGQGRKQTMDLAHGLPKAAGPLLAAAALAAAAAAPFLVETLDNDAVAKAADPSTADAMAEAALPPPTPRDAPQEPTPAGNGQGGPLIENDR
jgi:hypothetical protein